MNGITPRNRSEIKKLMDKNANQKYTKLNGKRYTVTDSYFSTWSYNMAYLLGYICTDGSVENKRHKALHLQLASIDVDLLKKIKEELQYTGPIRHRKVSAEKNGKKYDTDELVIHSHQIIEDLEKLGITANKSLVLGDFSFVPQQYQKAFLLGVLDGDGSIDQSYGKTNKNPVQIRIRYFSASLEFITSIRDMLRANGLSEVAIIEDKKNRKNSFYSISYSTKDSINFVKFYDNLTIYLNRKHDKLFTLIKKRLDYEKQNSNHKLKLRVENMPEIVDLINQ